MPELEDVKDEEKEEENKSINILPVILILLTLCFLVSFVKKLLIPALDAGDHRPTSVIEDINTEGYFEDVLGE